MSAVELGKIESLSTEPNEFEPESDFVQLDAEQEFYRPTQAIIDSVQSLLETAQMNPAWQDFTADLDKVLVAAQRLRELIEQFLRDNYAEGQINLLAFTATVRHDMRTPINAVIGYSEMLLEDLGDQNTAPEAGEKLPQILTLARQLLTLISDLSYLAKSHDKTPSQKSEEIENDTAPVVQTLASAEVPPLSMQPPVTPEPQYQWLEEISHNLQTPTLMVIHHMEFLLRHAAHRNRWADLTDDLDKILKASVQLSNLIVKLFTVQHYKEGLVDLDAFSATVRHDLRTPINAIIGYSEMLLEDLSDDNDENDACGHLQDILSLARRLLNLISDLGRSNEFRSPAKSPTVENRETPGAPVKLALPKVISTPAAVTPSPHDAANSGDNTDNSEYCLLNPELDNGQDLQTPTNSVIAYTAMLLARVKEYPELSKLVADLTKMLAAAEQLGSVINKLFSPPQHSDHKINLSTAMRHNLRTPINAIIGYGEILLEEVEETRYRDIFLDLQKIMTSSRRLLTLIDDLSHLSRSESKLTDEELTPSYFDTFGVEEEASPTLIDEVVRTLNTAENHVDLNGQEASLLVVDDKESNRDLLSRRLDRQGFRVEVAENGRQALNMVRTRHYDLVLLDIIMPEMNGYQVLAEMKADRRLKHLPVIMISALDEIDSVVRCIEMGAEDYLQKPFNQVILKAKISASLERKRLRDREHAFIKKLQIEQEKSEKLLLNILPKPVADRLKKGERTIADSFPEVTVLFSDLVGFTQMSAGIAPTELVERLNEIFLSFDILTELHNLEKIKTIGDAYMLVGGLPMPRADHVEAVADMAIDMADAISRLNRQNNSNIRIRVGIHTGPVVAGVIGKNKFNYDLWGDAVNIASRMESHGLPDHIQVSEATYHHIADKFIFERRGAIEVKGKGQMVTYFLKGRK
jgi:class 3 adenylate cyclase/CheY-like chemotaxis protein